MTTRPETRYTKSGEVHIAYQVISSGPLDLVYIPGFVSHLELAWENHAVQRLGIEIRAGLHTGEVEVGHDGVTGLAVHIGARVMAMAGPEEVLVSSTVKDLVAEAGIEFLERGTHVLKGVPGEWRLFAVTAA